MVHAAPALFVAALALQAAAVPIQNTEAQARAEQDLNGRAGALVNGFAGSVAGGLGGALVTNVVAEIKKLIAGKKAAQRDVDDDALGELLAALQVAEKRDNELEARRGAVTNGFIGSVAGGLGGALVTNLVAEVKKLTGSSKTRRADEEAPTFEDLLAALSAAEKRTLPIEPIIEESPISKRAEPSDEDVVALLAALAQRDISKRGPGGAVTVKPPPVKPPVIETPPATKPPVVETPPATTAPAAAGQSTAKKLFDGFLGSVSGGVGGSLVNSIVTEFKKITNHTRRGEPEVDFADFLAALQRAAKREMELD